MEAHLDWFGEWKMKSIGPQQDFFNRVPPRQGGRPFELSENMLYDPTNGTVSNGNIIRSQKRADNVQAPIRTGLLGAH